MLSMCLQAKIVGTLIPKMNISISLEHFFNRVSSVNFKGAA